ncbi:putative crossover junction endonuclease MUS81 [Rosellinia necatrix]|uniref:Crossover junction endonuclease MUS81 n=1 Tax=Rosellinia necatrix TaxID=77044 RepID=A0A1W2TDM0_ROSNE|nr:putative crossover junction endonuclease MUS81 [Rosellinia necatrix]
MASEETCANPLLLGWVKEWVDLARERNSKGVTTYRNAYNSLKACPITFNHPSQLQQLKGFGPKLCDRLTEKLQKHCQENGLPAPKRPRQWRVPGLNNENDADADLEQRPAKKPRKQKPYVPTLRSGAYALILGLTIIGEEAPIGMTKAQLIEAAQPHCDASFTAPSDPTRFYTAWNSMKTLLEKDLVDERGRPLRRYALTDEGWEVARRMQKIADLSPAELAAQQRRKSQAVLPENPPPPPLLTVSLPVAPQPPTRLASVEIEEIEPPLRPSYTDVVATGGPTSGSPDLPTFRPIRLVPGTFTVHLVLDRREIRAKTDRDYMQEELAKKGVKPIMRALELGDALWVAKCHDPNFLSRAGAEGDEIVLDWIVERKRLDDLVYSIRDGRFHEQKFRLKRSGVQNVIYIVEEISMDSMGFQKYEESVQSAIASTQVVNGYFVKKTQKMDDTIRYLSRMTMLLKKQYESKPLLVIPTEVITAKNFLPLLKHLREKEPTSGYYISYPAFASLVSKSDMITLRDLHLKMLMCTKQITGEKAIEIQKRWKTPYDFVKAYEKCGPGEEGKRRKQDLVFTHLGKLIGRKKITRALSRKLAEVWGDV